MASIMAQVPSCSGKTVRACAAPDSSHPACRARRCPENRRDRSGMQPVASWPWPSPLKIRCRCRVSPLAARSASTGGVTGSASPDNSSVGISLCKGRASPHPPVLAAKACRSHASASSMSGALVGLRDGGAIDVGGRKKRFVLAADDAVLHAVRQLIADLPHVHDGLRGQRPQLAVRRLDESARAAARLACCCRRESAARRSRSCG